MSYNLRSMWSRWKILNLLCFAAVLFCVHSATATLRLEPRKVEVASYKITVHEREGKCDLVYDGRHKGTITLDIAAPCEIVRDRFGEAQSFRYKRRLGAFDVILVVGGPVNKEKADELMKDGCGTQIQAISLSPRGVVAGSVGTYLIACPTAGFDEKDFAINARPN